MAAKCRSVNGITMAWNQLLLFVGGGRCTPFTDPENDDDDVEVAVSPPSAGSFVLKFIEFVKSGDEVNRNRKKRAFDRLENPGLTLSELFSIVSRHTLNPAIDLNTKHQHIRTLHWIWILYFIIITTVFPLIKALGLLLFDPSIYGASIRGNTINPI